MQAGFITPDFVVGRVHTGFYNAFFYHDKGKLCIFDKIVQALSAEKYKRKALFVTGHSLGEQTAQVVLQPPCMAASQQ